MQAKKLRNTWFAVTFMHFIYPIFYLAICISNATYHKDKFVFAFIQGWYGIVSIVVFSLLYRSTFKKQKNGLLLWVLPLYLTLPLFILIIFPLDLIWIMIAVMLAIWWLVISLILIKCNGEEQFRQLVHKKVLGHSLTYLESREFLMRATTREMLEKAFKEIRAEWPQYEVDLWCEYQMKKRKLKS